MSDESRNVLVVTFEDYAEPVEVSVGARVCVVCVVCVRLCACVCLCACIYACARCVGEVGTICT